MKKVLLIASIAITSLSGFAQNKKASPLSYSAGLELSLPVGDFGTGYSFGVGATAQADYRVTDKAALTLNVGYITYSGKTISIPPFSFKNPSLGVIPVLVGGKYSFNDKVYGSAQVGLSFFSGGGTGSNFTYAPGIGYNVTKNIDLLLKYTGISVTGGSFGSIGLRAAYTF